MILYTNGCSWTWGGSLGSYFKNQDGSINLEKRLSLLWPHHLGNLMAADQVINIAEGCGSNQRIVRTTFDWLKEQPESILKETVAVIQFTDASRLELYEPATQDKYENLPGQWVKAKWDLVSLHSIYQGSWDREQMLQKAQKRIAETHAIEDIYRNIGYLYALEGMFKTFGIKNWYYWHLGHSNGWLRNFTSDFVKVFNSQLNIIDKDEQWNYERVNSKGDNHPSVLGQKQIANIIYEKISEKTHTS